MPIGKATLRNMPLVTQKVAKLLNELDSVHTRLLNALPQLEGLELWQRGHLNRQAFLDDLHRGALRDP